MPRFRKLVDRFNSDNVFHLLMPIERARCFEIKQGTYVEMDNPAYTQLLFGRVSEVVCDKNGIPVFARVEGQDESGRNRIDYFPIQDIKYYENDEWLGPFGSYLNQKEKDEWMEAIGCVRTKYWDGSVWYNPEDGDYATFDETYGPLPEGMTPEEAFGK